MKEEMRGMEEELNRLHASVGKGPTDPQRLLIIDAPRSGERNVRDLCDELGLPQANASQHLAVLREKGLVRARKNAQKVFYSVSDERIIEAVDSMREVMAAQLGVAPVS